MFVCVYFRPSNTTTLQFMNPLDPAIGGSYPLEKGTYLLNVLTVCKVSIKRTAIILCSLGWG